MVVKNCMLLLMLLLHNSNSSFTACFGVPLHKQQGQPVDLKTDPVDLSFIHFTTSGNELSTRVGRMGKTWR